jgi:hypothetical protein
MCAYMHRSALPVAVLLVLLLNCTAAGSQDSGEKVYREGLTGIGESLVVEENEVIRGDVVSIGGDVEISGTVEGDVVSVGGALLLRHTAVVKGDAIAIGGRIDRDEHAEIHGELVSIGIWFYTEGGSDARSYI